MIRFISLLVAIPLIVLIATFTYKNAQLVPIDLFIMQIKLPLALLLLAALFIGAILGFFFNVMTLLGLKKKHSKLARKRATLNDLPEALNKPSSK